MQSENNQFWEQYERSLNLIRYIVILFEMLLVCFRIYMMTKPSFICLLEILMIMLLGFMNNKIETQRQAKLYIIMNFLVMGFLTLNFQGSFSAFDISKTLYEQTFPDSFKHIFYPIEFAWRIVLTLIGWRLCQFSKLKYLYQQQNGLEESESL